MSTLLVAILILQHTLLGKMQFGFVPCPLDNGQPNKRMVPISTILFSTYNITMLVRRLHATPLRKVHSW